MMEYKYLEARGALNESTAQRQSRAPQTMTAEDAPGNRMLASRIPPSVVELVPHSVARENVVMPLVFDGETVTLAAVNTEDLLLTDKLRFILGKNVRLVLASQEAILKTINKYYGHAKTESVDSMLQEFTDTAIDFTESDYDLNLEEAMPRSPGKGIVQFKKDSLEHEEASAGEPAPARQRRGLDNTPWFGGSGMFYFVVEEGQRVLMRRPNGTMEVIPGPRSVWRIRRKFYKMAHYIAHPGEFLIIRYRDGRQEHLPGPAEIWMDPRIHQSISAEDGLQLSSKEAVVVYSKPVGSTTISRRIVYGPTLFIPEPGEWLHTFSWHASRGGHKGVQKVPNALVFQKLWLMPDQMYHDVTDVRTGDDAVLTIRLMIFFELMDIERMLDTTHDPIGDFVNAATSDVVECVGRYEFESFKKNTNKLNELETYRQLTGRATQCGYRITKVVYRGYGAAESLQQMHDQAIEARTRLQLDRATEQQAQDLENYKLECQIARAGKRRVEQEAEVVHDLELARKRQDADIRQREAQQLSLREQRRLEAELQQQIRQRQEAQQREHLAALREMAVDLTAYLTQGRADRVIELRGDARPHIHLDQLREENAQKIT